MCLHWALGSVLSKIEGIDSYVAPLWNIELFLLNETSTGCVQH